ncbi:MAG: DUF3267 domain-containing protein [Ktedonobacteraceae bacterium]|nr:DUF3267 domain-containing protein [Ktedonobacteraceae bacterium]
MHRHDLPRPPKGYYCAATFQYPERFVYIAKTPPLIILGVFYLRAGLNQDVFHGAARQGPWIFIFMIVVGTSTDFVSRLVQRKISRLLGYDTSLLTWLDTIVPGTYTAAPGQFQPRRDVLLIAIAPLSLFLGLFLLLWLPLLFGLSGIISDLLFFFLLVNMAGSLWDLYFIGWLLRKPTSTLIYQKRNYTYLAFEPGKPQKANR